MRIGQILLEAEIITPKQLSDGLEYAAAKSIFLGKALMLLKYASDADVERGLHTQKLIKMGLSPVLAVEGLKRSTKEGISLQQALQDEHLDALPPSEPKSAAKVALESTEGLSPEVLVKNGDNLLIQDCCSEAAVLYEKALEAMEAALGSQHIDLAPVLVRLGNTHLAANSFEEAKQCYDKVMEIRKNSLSEDHPQVAQTFESLADLYYAQGLVSQAIESFLLALDILEKNLPAQLGNYAAILKRLATAAQNSSTGEGRTLPVGEILKAAGLLSDRELQTALRMSKQQSLPLGIVLRENCMVGDRELQSALKAQFCVRQGVLSEQLAIDLLTRASRRGISLERLLHEAGVLVSDQEKFEIYRQIASDLDKLVAAESSAVNSQQELAPVAFRLGTSYEQVGDQRQAEVYYSRALAIWGAAIRGDLTAAKTCISLAKILQGQNRKEEVLPLLQKALEHRQHALGKAHEETIDTLELVAEAELALWNNDDALKHAQEAVSAREALGQDGGDLLRSVVLTGDAMLQQKNYEGAQAAFKRAMALAQPKDGRPTAALAAVMEKQADLYNQQGLQKVAAPLYKSALLILEAAGKRETKSFEALKEKASRVEQCIST